MIAGRAREDEGKDGREMEQLNRSMKQYESLGHAIIMQTGLARSRQRGASCQDAGPMIGQRRWEIVRAAYSFGMPRPVTG